MDDLMSLAPDKPASVLWCNGECCDVDEPRLRSDFDRLDEALRFVGSEMPLGRRHTAWIITDDRLLPPEQVLKLLSS